MPPNSGTAIEWTRLLKASCCVVHHLRGPSDGLIVVLDKDIGQRPHGDVSVVLIWPPVQNRSLGEALPSQNLLVLATVPHAPV